MTRQQTKHPLRPILVVMSWRGGARFERCLRSIAPAVHHFSRVVLSVTSAPDSADMHAARTFADAHSGVEVICTGRELPTMQHQGFWVDYLKRTGAESSDWIFWLAYDDEVRPRGIDAIIDADGGWPLRDDTVYVGPWAMRHESANALWAGDPVAPLESWTSFPADGPLRLPLLRWVREQLRQPTYMQMSGSLMPFHNYLELRDGRPRKTGPMRIEMATAAGSRTMFVAELSEPVTVIYGRSNSDRASYGTAARREDAHLLAWLGRWAARHPAQAGDLAGILTDHLMARARRTPSASEDWRIRTTVQP